MRLCETAWPGRQGWVPGGSGGARGGAGDDWPAGAAVRDAPGDAPVRARRAAAQRVSGQDGAQPCLADDQDPAGQFASQRPGRALADRVRPGRLPQTRHDPQAAGPDDGAELPGELAAAW